GGSFARFRLPDERRRRPWELPWRGAPVLERGPARGARWREWIDAYRRRSDRPDGTPRPITVQRGLL
ncbi:unnamed protein product, partial [Urochloa humidicola]